MNVNKIVATALALTAMSVAVALPAGSSYKVNTAAAAVEYSDVTSGAVTYRVYNDHVETLKCDTAASGELVVPAVFSELPVTAVGSGTFRDCQKLTSVTLPDTVAAIGESAFSNCTSLQKINIGSGIREIGCNAFYGSPVAEALLSGTWDRAGAFISCADLAYVISLTAKGNTL